MLDNKTESPAKLLEEQNYKKISDPENILTITVLQGQNNWYLQ